MDNLEHTAKKVLSIVYKTDLNADEQEKIMEETIYFWKQHGGKIIKINIHQRILFFSTENLL